MTAGTTTNLFDYNVRSELTNVVMADNKYNYDYDPIGNRKSVVRIQNSE